MCPHRTGVWCACRQYPCVKVALHPEGSRRVKPENEACRTIALERGLALREVCRGLERLLED